MHTPPDHTTQIPNPFPANVHTVGIFAPAGIPDPCALQRGTRRLRDWGLQVLADGVDQEPCRFLAGTDDARARALNRLLRDERVDALVAAKGGYGCTRILESVDWERLVQRALPLIGYSDLTSLHLAAYRHGLRSGVAGPMVAGDLGREGTTEADLAQLRSCLLGLRAALQRRSGWSPAAITLCTLRHGSCSGPLIPANLAVLCSLLGTDYMPDLSGCILVLEDVNEPAYRIDRFLTQLRQTGVIERIAGLVFGMFTHCEDHEWLPDVQKDAAAYVDGPVVSGFPFGHVFPSMSLPVGAPALLVAEQNVPPMLRLPP